MKAEGKRGTSATSTRSIRSAQLPPAKYRVIYADPPWKTQHRRRTGEQADHYRLMEWRSCEWPISDMADDNAVLSVVRRRLRSVVRRGDRTTFVWDKSPQLATTTACATSFCFLPRAAADVPSSRQRAASSAPSTAASRKIFAASSTTSTHGRASSFSPAPAWLGVWGTRCAVRSRMGRSGDIRRQADRRPEFKMHGCLRRRPAPATEQDSREHRRRRAGRNQADEMGRQHTA